MNEEMNEDLRKRVFAALNRVGSLPHHSGPNGPLSDRRIIMPDGTVRRDLFQVAREWGFTPLVRQHLSTEIFAGVQ